MRRLTPFFAVLCGLGAALAGPPTVRFPEVAAAPQPMPAAVAVLTADRLFVVESKEPVVILSSPAGLVKVTAKPGPLTVFSRFADGPDKAELRTFAGPHVFLLEPIKSGECELFVIPEKVTQESDIIRRPLKVDAGEGPRPPPVDPRPDPKPEPAKKAEKVSVVVLEETQQRTPTQAVTLADQSFNRWIRDGGHSLYLVDKDDPVAIRNGYTAATASVGLPAVLVFDAAAQRGLPLVVFKLPGSATELTNKVKEVVK